MTTAAPVPSGTPVPFGTPTAQAEPFRVPLRDGVRLHTQVYLPPSPARVPAVLIRTPYDTTHPDTLLPDIAARLTEAGMAVVTQDVRGKIRSEGVPVPFTAETSDAWDTLEWITGQPWSDGTVGCWGNSYYGCTAWAAATCGHPAVRALAARLTTTDIGGELAHRSGVFRLGPMAEWLTSTWAGRANLVPRLDWSVRPLARLLDHLPTGSWELPPAAMGPHTARRRTLAPDGVRRPGSRARAGADAALDGLVRPVLHRAVARLAAGAGQRPGPLRRAPQYLIATATDHHDDVLTAHGRSPDHLTDPLAREAMLDRTLGPVIDFFRHHLCGGGGQLVPPPVRWQGAGTRLRAAASWPPPDAEVLRLHLTGARAAATAGPEGGALSPRPGTRHAPALWDHDPADLVPATDGDWWRPLLALPDERTVERRPDVLTFTATAAHRPLQLAGPARLVLPVTSTAAVSHLVVKLCDVAPDGTSRRILEAPYRMDTGGPSWHRAPVHLGDTGHRLETGHRLRVQVASSCFPLYLPHTAGPEHPWRVRHAAGSSQRLLTGGPDGACLELTVLPGTHTRPS